jgi:hypothetical protein
MSDPTIRAALDAAANSLREGFRIGGRAYEEDAAAAIAAFLRALPADVMIYDTYTRPGMMTHAADLAAAVDEAARDE